MSDTKDHAKQFFEGIKTIRTTQFLHYLIQNESILEIGAMKAIYFELKAIDNLLEEHSWGLLYPFYKFYKRCRGIYRLHRSNQKLKVQKKKFRSSTEA